MSESNGQASRTMTFPSLVRYREAWQAPSIEKPITRPGVRLSAVLIVHNAGSNIGAVVSELFELTRPFVVQVIVVDDASDDDTGAVLGAISNGRLEVIRQVERSGTALGLGRALQSITGTHVCIIDIDAGVSPDDLGKLVAPLTEGTSETVLGARRRGIVPSISAFIRNPCASVTTHFMNLIFDADMLEPFPGLVIVPLAILEELKLSGSGYRFDVALMSELLRRKLEPSAITCDVHARHARVRRPMTPVTLFSCLLAVISVRRRGLIDRAPAEPVEIEPAAELDALLEEPTSEADGDVLLEEENADALVTPPRRRRSARNRQRRLILGLGAAAVVVVMVLQYPGRGIAGRIGASPPIERFTELYFPQPLSLPQTLREGKPFAFSFAITNRESTSRTYGWSIQVQRSGRSLTLSTGTSTVAPDHSSDVSLEINGLHGVGTSTVYVFLIRGTEHQAIFFHVNVTS